MSDLAALPSPPRLPDLHKRLSAVVREEFRVLVFVPEVGDVVFGSPPCAVGGCGRSSYLHSLCSAHGKRWNQAGAPVLETWVDTVDPGAIGHRALGCCRAPGCRFGQLTSQLCPRHSRAFTHSSIPDIERWLASLPSAGPSNAPTCAVAGCLLLAERGEPHLCLGHRTRWRGQGRPATEQFLFDCATYGEPRFDLRALTATLRLEIQYALQSRHDERRTKTPARHLRPLIAALGRSGAASLLDHAPEQRAAMLAGHGANSTTLAFVNYAIDQVAFVRDGAGWDNEYPRDRWQLRRLGLPVSRSAHLDFRSLGPPWLRELAKRYLRWRISTEISLAQIRRDLTAINRFSQLAPGIGALPGPARLSRALLEGYLAALRPAVANTKSRHQEISALSGFLRTAIRHGWAPALAAGVMFFPEDFPRLDPDPPSRALPESVMAQLEAPASLDKLTDPRSRLLIEILMRAGLRINDACKLPLDCLVHDQAGAPYLRYRNHKMRREALVPIDDTLTAMVKAQQATVRSRFPLSQVLIPRSSSNPDGLLPMPSATLDSHLRAWLTRCEVLDELGRPAKATAHQFRHTYATRLINNEVPEETVRRLLDHDSHTMTSRYARLADTTIRQQWEQARKINIRGETLATEADQPLSEAAWAKENIARATQALPNGYCTLPLQKSCPHANACLTCPLFATTTQFLPEHHRQLAQTRTLIEKAEQSGRTRLAEMNRTVQTNLLTIITTLEQPGCCASAGQCGCTRSDLDEGLADAS